MLIDLSLRTLRNTLRSLTYKILVSQSYAKVFAKTPKDFFVIVFGQFFLVNLHLKS
jgi:hypothetical protein